jgi:putative ABC transport system permease protein
VRSIIKMAFTNLKRKKLQSLLIGIIIMVSALIFTTSLGILGGINSPFEKMHKKQNASHLALIFDKNMHNPDEIAAWWKSQSEVSSISSVMQLAMIENPIKDGKKVETQFFMAEIPKSITTHDKLTIVEGKKKECPASNEIWVPTALAYSRGIHIGDKLDIPVPDGKKRLIVSAIVVDPLFSTSMINPTRAWVASGVLNQWFPAKSLNNVFIGVRYNDLSKEKVLWDRFQKFLGKPFSGIKFTYSLFSMAFLMMYQLIGVMLLVFSVILLLIALYVLSSSIKDAVISDYKTIGILKSEGYTPGNVILIYTLQMAIVSLLSIPVGIALSTFAIKKVLESLMKSMGMVDVNMNLSSIFALAFIILFTLILFSTFISSGKAGKVKPAEAIKYGAPIEDLISRNKKSSGILRKLPVITYIGTNQLLASKRQIVFSFITFLAAIFVIVIGINSYYSLQKTAENSSFVGFDDSDVTIVKKVKTVSMDNKDIQVKIQSDSRVKNVLQAGFLLTGVIPSDSSNAAFNIIGDDYDGNMDGVGFQNIEGKSPVNEDEIALATNTAKTYNKKPGDYFNMYVEGKEIRFKVTGIYQSFNNMGQGYRIQTKAVKKVNPSYEPDMFLVKLKDSKDTDAFISDMDKEFGDSIDAKKTKDLFSQVMKPIVDNMGMAIVFICLVFIIVLVITIFSSSLLSINKQKRNFGILKTIGLTPVQVRLSIVVRYLLIGVIAIIAGLFSGLVLTPVLLTAMCSSMGIISFPTVTNLIQTVMVIPFSLILAFICSWIPSGQIMKINSRTLVSE